MSIVPDKLINLEIKKFTSIAKIKQNITAINQDIYGDAADIVADNHYDEQLVAMGGVKEVFGRWLYTLDCGELVHQDVADKLARLL